MQKFSLIIFMMLFVTACEKEIIQDAPSDNKIMINVWYENEYKQLVHDREANIYLYPEFDFIYQQCTYEWDGVYVSRGVKYLPTEYLQVDDSNYIYVDQAKYKRFLLVIECRSKKMISTFYKLGKDPMQKLSVTFH